MKRSSNPWVFFLLVTVLVLVVIGVLDYLRREELKSLGRLEAQVKTATKKVQDLNNREAKLKVTAARRTDLESRLFVLKDGNLYAQSLMAAVNDRRSVNARLADIRFKILEGSVTVTTLDTTITGTEAQALRFIELVEQGRPLGQIVSIGWPMVVQNGQDPNGVAGNVTLQIKLYGPLNMPQAPAKPATTKPPTTTKP